MIVPKGTPLADLEAILRGDRVTEATLHQIYTFVSPTGENIHIDSQSLYHWCEEQGAVLPIHQIPVDQPMAESFLRDNIVAPQRLLDLVDRFATGLTTPIIFCKDGTFAPNGGPKVLLVDGHHRYTCAAGLGHKEILSYILEVSQWEPFRLDGLPTMTQAELLALPILKRDY